TRTSTPFRPRPQNGHTNASSSRSWSNSNASLSVRPRPKPDAPLRLAAPWPLTEAAAPRAWGARFADGHAPQGPERRLNGGALPVTDRANHRDHARDRTPFQPKRTVNRP